MMRPMDPRPMLATTATSLPSGADWTYEVKWDGYRVLAMKDGARVRLISRNQKDLTRNYPTVVRAIASLPAKRVTLDGELVALDSDGRPSFQALQHRSTTDLTLTYYAFDLIDLDGHAWIGQPLDVRRRQLRKIVDGSSVLLSDTLPGSVQQIERAVRDMGLEGVVAKRHGSIYRPGQRSNDWVKVKFSPRQDFVIGGYKPAGANFESILVGYYSDAHELLFAGKVRSGFTPHARAEFFRELSRHPRRSCPFVNFPNASGRSHWGEGITEEDMAKLRWVRPSIVAEVSFVEWTRDGLLRHPAFVGVRDDIEPAAVRRESLAH